MEWRGAFAASRQLSADSFVPVNITAVAVWDTVGALGIPLGRGMPAADLFRFCDTTLHPGIGLGLHAVALDERRQSFAPTLWDDDPRVTQALFPGGHCDAGGGTPEHGLSDGPLTWFVDRLQQSDVGVRFALHPACEVSQDAGALRHCAWVETAAWAALGLAARDFRAGLVVHDSVRQRMTSFGKTPEKVELRAGAAAGPYAPGNLPQAG